MKSNPKRTQAERSAATRHALIAAARPMFASDGFAGVSTEAVVRAAGVTRGALYHQFADKTELFAAVFEQVEQEVMGRIDSVVAESGLTDLLDLMTLGARTWLEACAEPEVHRIAMTDAPAVLGWERWRDIGMRYGIGLVRSLVDVGLSTGLILPLPADALCLVIIGALDEAALYVGRADDRATALEEMGAVLDQMLRGLTVR